MEKTPYYGLKIGGFQPFSLTDFPNTTCSIIFTQGCNFRCPYCHNKELIPKRAKKRIKYNVIVKKLKKKSPMVDGVVITGGEPTIQPLGLYYIITKLKDWGYKVKLDTNGSNPRILERLIQDKMLDFVSLDIKTSYEKYDLVIGTDEYSDIEYRLRASVQMLIYARLRKELNFNVRTTLFTGIANDVDIKAIRLYFPTSVEHVINDYRYPAKYIKLDRETRWINHDPKARFDKPM
jgi:pyruvate formate lyase activating enzyme